jgi:hypothetical protein
MPGLGVRPKVGLKADGASTPFRLMRMAGGWIYIITNRPNGTLYVGVTSDLPHRIQNIAMGSSKASVNAMA